MKNEKQNFNEEDVMALMEALLFVSGEKMTIGKLAKTSCLPVKKIEKAIFQLQLRLKQERRGIQLLVNGNKVQLVAAKEWSPFIQKIIKENFQEDLTPAALESMAIVAYGAPITKNDVDEIRGVDSSFTLRSLMIRGLIERDRSWKKKEQFVYKPTLEFYKFLGVENQEGLPDYKKYYEFIESSESSDRLKPLNEI